MTIVCIERSFTADFLQQTLSEGRLDNSLTQAIGFFGRLLNYLFFIETSNLVTRLGGHA
ncbi:MAG: hypothetical protein ACR2IV_17650 [Bryobacteraceae bacterium]